MWDKNFHIDVSEIHSLQDMQQPAHGFVQSYAYQYPLDNGWYNVQAQLEDRITDAPEF